MLRDGGEGWHIIAFAPTPPARTGIIISQFGLQFVVIFFFSSKASHAASWAIAENVQLLQRPVSRFGGGQRGETVRTARWVIFFGLIKF